MGHPQAEALKKQIMEKCNSNVWLERFYRTTDFVTPMAEQMARVLTGLDNHEFKTGERVFLLPPSMTSVCLTCAYILEGLTGQPVTLVELVKNANGDYTLLGFTDLGILKRGAQNWQAQSV